MPDVSVIIPLYGNHAGRQVLGQVIRTWLEQDVLCEVIVSTMGDAAVAVPEGIGAHRVRIVRTDPSTPGPGQLRNAAASHARSSLFYLSDADVQPLRRDYLAGALRLGAGGAFAQPWMYRLVGSAAGQRLLRWRVSDGGFFCFVTADAHGNLRPRGGEQLALDGADLMVVQSPELQVGYAETELRWRPAFHWGGLMVERRLFEEVGGYCPRYTGWGCEDDDLLVKVSARCAVVRAWQTEPGLACLHFEHPRPYETAEFAANEAVLSERVRAGPAAMIKEDESSRGR